MQGDQYFHRSIGRSVEGRDIVIQANFDLAAIAPAGATLLIGGTHGDEQATIVLLERFLARGLPATPVAVLPLHNPDGFLRRSRYNAHGVDVNRNAGFNWRAECDEPAGPEPWSEPETRALRDFVLTARPAKIVSLHWALAEIDADGHQSTALGQAMWDAMGEVERRPYRLRVTELGRGQRRLQRLYAACPGSFGQWCGYGLEYPEGTGPAMVTLELPFDPTVVARPDDLEAGHLDFVHALWQRDPTGYLRAVEPGVFQMLDAACRHRD